MKALKIISALCGVMIAAPIWYYLLYKILEGVNATELMWFLYFIYVPVALFGGVIQQIAAAGGKK